MFKTYQIKKLSDVCDISAGNSAPQKKEFFTDGKYPFFRTSDVGVIHIGKISDSNNYLNDKGIKGLRLFKKGTILLPKSGASTFLNHRVIMDVDGYVSSHLATIKVDEKILNNHFLFYFLQEIKAQDLIQDHKYPSLNLPVIGGIEMPIPSLAEQCHVVKILDEVFEKTAKAKENAKKNLQNAKELHESYLQSIFTDSKYEYKSLGTVCKIIGGGTPSKTGSNITKYYDGLIPWATVRDMKIEIITETQHKITKEAVQNSSTNIIPKGNVIIATRVGLGKVCLIKNDTAINQDLRGIVPFNQDKLLIGYLFQWLKSVSDLIIKEGTGATVQGVKLPFVKSLLIPIPKTLSEQKLIVAKLDNLSVETKKLETIYKQKLADLDELKKSILKKAFNGEL